jgi:ketosteroid isomerase-like protein
VVQRSHLAWGEFIKGDPEPAKLLFSRAEDVSNANPFGPVARGWKNVTATMDRAAGFYRDGEVLGFDTMVSYATAELGFIVEMERYSIKVGGRPDRTPVTFRVTSVLRLEDGSWKIMHRHADPISTVQPAESVIRT